MIPFLVIKGKYRAMKYRRQRLITMLLLTGGFFVVELVVGYIAGSISLIADSFHMLSDTIGLGVGLYAIQLTKETEGRSCREAHQ